MICCNLLVASAAPRALGTTSDAHGGEAVCHGRVHSPRGLVRAHVGGTAVTARGSGTAGERVVVNVAGRNWGADIGLAAPGAGTFAAVPVAGRRSISRGLCCRECGETGGEGKERERSEGRHLVKFFFV